MLPSARQYYLHCGSLHCWASEGPDRGACDCPAGMLPPTATWPAAQQRPRASSPARAEALPTCFGSWPGGCGSCLRLLLHLLDLPGVLEDRPPARQRGKKAGCGTSQHARGWLPADGSAATSHIQEHVTSRRMVRANTPAAACATQTSHEAASTRTSSQQCRSHRVPCTHPAR